MKRQIKRGVAAAAAVMSASTAIFLGNTSGASAAGPSVPAFGLVNGTTMSSFLTNNPAKLDWVADIVGFVGCDTRLIGVDMRVQDGLLYGVGNCPSSAGFANIYTIPFLPTSDFLMPITKVSQLTVPLDGTTFDVDFNPAADRLRIISDNGQNLRHNLGNHTTIADMPLNLNGPLAKGVTAAAYTNNDLNGGSATTLFTIDTLNDQVAIQAPPNNGILNPTGNLGVNAGLDAGADIFSDLPSPGSPSGKTITNTAFAAFVPTGATRASFYMFDVLTGTATKIGDFPSIAPVTDVAVDLDRS
jgi:uncharacterized protein DUF4394